MSCDLVIPEVVAWELFEHYSRHEQAFEAALSTFNRARDRHDLDAIPPPPPLALDEFLERIAATGATIAKLTGEEARAALQDQILQTGPATSPKGIKTGGADSAWLRAVLVAGSGSYSDVTVVTGDKRAVKALAESMGIDPPRIVRSLPELGTELGCQPASENDAASALATAEAQIALFEPSIAQEVHRWCRPEQSNADIIEARISALEWSEEPPIWDKARTSVSGLAWAKGELAMTFEHIDHLGRNWGELHESVDFELEATVDVRLQDGDRQAELLYFDVLSVLDVQ